jgi:hypothetical protein
VLELAPMKNGLAVIGRFLLCFLGVELLAIIILAAGQLSETSEGAASLSAAFWVGYALESFPIATAVAAFGAGFVATRRLRHRPCGYILLFLLSAGILCGGVYLSKGISAPPEPFPAKAPVPVAQGASMPFFVQSSSGSRAQGIVYVKENKKAPRLAWADTGEYIPAQRLLLADKTAIVLPATSLSFPSPSIPGLPEVRAWYLGLGSYDFKQALIAVAGTAALLCGLWPLSRLFRWPLLGFFASGAALTLLGALHSVFRSPSVRELAGIVGLNVSDSILLTILCGACGVALFSLDFVLCPALKGASARRNRGSF